MEEVELLSKSKFESIGLSMGELISKLFFKALEILKKEVFLDDLMEFKHFKSMDIELDSLMLM